MATPTKYPEMWKWRWASDKDYHDYNVDYNTFSPSFPNINDAMTAFGMYFFFVHLHVWEWLAFILVGLGLGSLQFKNAIFPYFNYKADGTYTIRYGGGWGASIKNFMWAGTGLVCALLLDLMWPPAIRKPPQNEELEGENDMAF